MNTRSPFGIIDRGATPDPAVVEQPAPAPAFHTADLYVIAGLLGYDPGDMVALTGVRPVFADARVHPAAAELAAPAWNARRLTRDQVAVVLEVFGR
ncbi:hypothetical protein ACIA5D_15250 [Actinoplanes sp. NPDC051513]|uniref:hypothetical protein n=1 Tax=Actinoplanes sp. NPDC051513 TaxID=3363908 RepID=UPI0037B7D07E